MAEMKTCGNCGQAIGRLEPENIWSGEPVCALCHARLTQAPALSASPPARGYAAIALAIIAAGVIVIAVGIIVHLNRKPTFVISDAAPSAPSAGTSSATAAGGNATFPPIASKDTTPATAPTTHPAVETLIATVTTRPSTSPVPAPAEPWKPRVVNLMPLIDTTRDTLEAGYWSAEAGDLVTPSDCRVVLEIPYYPPSEYDFRIEFTRKNGNAVIMIGSHAGTVVHWVMATASSGFERVKGNLLESSPAKVDGELLGMGQRQSAVVEVRKKAVRAYIDGKLIVDWKTNWKDLSGNVDRRDMKRLALRTWDCNVAIHTVEVNEISGPGEPIKNP